MNNNDSTDMEIKKLSSKYTLLNKKDIFNISNHGEGIREIGKIIKERNKNECMLCFDSDENMECVHQTQMNGNINADDMYEHLLLAKDNVIEELSKKIEELNKRLIDQSVTYNEKIDRVRMEHRRQLSILHNRYRNKNKTC